MDTGGQAERLATLVRLNTEVHRAYLLKEMFRRFWEYKRPGWAKRFLKLWCAWAVGLPAQQPSQPFVTPARAWATNSRRFAA